MKSSFCKLTMVLVLSIILFHLYAYLFNSIIRINYGSVSYQINPHLINVIAFIRGTIIGFSRTINIYLPFIIITLLIYIQTSLHRSWLKTLCFLLIYPLLVYLSAHIVLYSCSALIYSLSISPVISIVLQTLIYTLFILLIAVIYSKLAKLKPDGLFENDKMDNWSQSLLYSLLFVYFIWQITTHTLSYNFFINYNFDPKIDSLINVLTFFYSLFMLVYLILWTYPYLTNNKQRDNFIRLSSTFFIICMLWGVIIIMSYSSNIIYNLMRWFTDSEESKKRIILFLAYAAFIFFMRKNTYNGVHYLLCVIITFLVAIILNEPYRNTLGSLALQLCYIAVCITIFYIIHNIAFRIAFYKKNIAKKEFE